MGLLSLVWFIAFSLSIFLFQVFQKNGFLKVFVVVCKTLNLGLAAMMLQVQGLRAATSSKIAEGQDCFEMVPSKFIL